MVHSFVKIFSDAIDIWLIYAEAEDKDLFVSHKFQTFNVGLIFVFNFAPI